MNIFLSAKRSHFYLFSFIFSLFLSALASSNTCQCAEKKIEQNESEKKTQNTNVIIFNASFYKDLEKCGSVIEKFEKKDQENFKKSCGIFCKNSDLDTKNLINQTTSFLNTLSKQDFSKLISMIPFFKFDRELLKVVLDALLETKSIEDNPAEIFGDPYYHDIFTPIKNSLIPITTEKIASRNKAFIEDDDYKKKIKQSKINKKLVELGILDTTHIEGFFKNKKDTYRATVECKKYVNNTHSSTQTINKKCTLWKHTDDGWLPILDESIPTLSHIFLSDNGDCQITSLCDGTYCTKSNSTPNYKDKTYHFEPKKPLNIKKDSPLKKAIANESIADGKFTPYEKDTMVFVSEGGWITGQNSNPLKIYNFFTDSIMPCEPVREIFPLGSRHFLLRHRNDFYSETYGLSPATYVVYKLLSAKKEVSIYPSDLKKKSFINSLSLFEIKDEVNKEFSSLKLPLHIKCEVSNWIFKIKLEGTL